MSNWRTISYPPPTAWSVKTRRRAPSRHRGDAKIYGPTTTVIHDMNTPPHYCLWKWPHQKTSQFIQRCHPYARKSALRAVLSRMQPLHFTRLGEHLTALASRLVQAINVCLVGENPTACSVPALWGCQGLWSCDYGHA